jgi:hypothetical protein
VSATFELTNRFTSSLTREHMHPAPLTPSTNLPVVTVIGTAPACVSVGDNITPAKQVARLAA